MYNFIGGVAINIAFTACKTKIKDEAVAAVAKLNKELKEEDSLLYQSENLLIQKISDQSPL